MAGSVCNIAEKKTLRSLLSEEHQAIDHYGKADKMFHLEHPGVARLMKHIQGEEREHAAELKEKLRA